MTRRVELVTWTPEWARRFEAERAALAAAIGPEVLQIEHIGSTSIPGIAAKPVIDVGVAVTRFEEARSCVEPLERLGYAYRGEHGIPRRHFFQKGDPRTHNLHMLEIESAEWQNHLAFRDYLRADTDTAHEYEALKHRLAEKHRDDVEAYAEAKTDFVREVLRRAAALAAG